MIATTYERIHRSNLVGMGVLPLEFPEGTTWKSLGLDGKETFDFPELDGSLEPRSTLKVVATKDGGEKIEFDANVRIDTPVEMDYFRNGGFCRPCFVTFCRHGEIRNKRIRNLGALARVCATSFPNFVSISSSTVSHW